MTRIPGEESSLTDFIVTPLCALGIALKQHSKEFLPPSSDMQYFVKVDELHLDPFYNVFIHLMATAVASLT